VGHDGTTGGRCGNRTKGDNVEEEEEEEEVMKMDAELELELELEAFQTWKDKVLVPLGRARSRSWRCAECLLSAPPDVDSELPEHGRLVAVVVQTHAISLLGSRFSFSSARRFAAGGKEGAASMT